MFILITLLLFSGLLNFFLPLCLLLTSLKLTSITHPCYNISSSDPYTIVSCRLPDDVRLRPSIGNGHLATVVHSPVIDMNGLYNGHGNESHRASIPSPLFLNVSMVNGFPVSNRTFTLDARKGVFNETLYTADVTVTLKWFAHRAVLPLLVFEISVQRRVLTPLLISLDVNQWGTSPDIDFQSAAVEFDSVSYRYGKTKQAETSTSGIQTVHLIFTDIPQVLRLNSSELSFKWTFLTSVHVHKQEAIDAFKLGLKLLASGRLFETHVEGWIELWQTGSIEVDGNLALARTLAASQYYLFSSIPSTVDESWPFIGLSPSGLAWGDEQNYCGHVFWDQETWMFPPLLMLHADVFGRQLLATRFRTVSAAAENARLTGYDGLRFPWESGFTGVETTDSETCAALEVHISADISFAMNQYLLATGDHDIFSNNSFVDIVFGIADFWISRLHYNESRQLYDILHVVPPDEYATDVNNSVFTNMAAIKSLEFGAKIANICHFAAKEVLYKSYANKIYIPFDNKAGYHPEYDGYVIGTTVKQADVILLGFPFMWNMSSEVRHNDLKTYSMVMSPHGPAMSDSMYTIGWLEVGHFDAAVESFKKMFEHVAGEFLVWTENKKGDGATNFITGIGGFLQAVLFGFGGMRLRCDQLYLNPVLPPDCTSLRLIGVDYMGSGLSVDIYTDNVTVTLTSLGRSVLQLRTKTATTVLSFNKPVTVGRGELSLEAVDKSQQIFLC